MNLIINKKIPMFKKGYPTVSDKYNVQGAVLESDSTAVGFGDLVMRGDTNGYYKAIGTIAAADIVKIMGFIVATNVKLATEWPANDEEIKVTGGESFGLMLNGFIATTLASTAKSADILANAPVHVTAAGLITTSTDTASIGALSGYVFTGMYETQGETLYAEVYVK